MLPNVTSGTESGPVLLFLHGFMGSSEDWTPIVSRLKDRYRCVRVDLPGHGAATGRTEDEYTMDGTCRAVIDTLDALGISRCTPVGYSMGGRTALYFGIHHPERCDRLLLESASPGLATAEARAARRAVDADRARRLERDGMEAFLGDWYQLPLFAPLQRHPDYVEAMLERRHRNEAHELARSLRGMGTGQQPSLWERLPALQVSTLALAGALDGKYVRIARQMAANAPRLRARIIEDAGHVIHAERPTQFIDAVEGFVPSA